MNNETSNDTSAFEAEVRDTVEQGDNVQEKVRQLTLRVISARSLDIESVRQTADAVLRGARAGVQKELQHSSAQTHIARDHLNQAVTGLDIALAQFAEAAKLTVEEAAGRAKKYSSEDLKRARADLASLETMFVETLQSSASAAKNAAGEILHDLAAHTRTHGSARHAAERHAVGLCAPYRRGRTHPGRGRPASREKHCRSRAPDRCRRAHRPGRSCPARSCPARTRPARPTQRQGRVMLWQALIAARDLGRLHEIALVLIRYGFGDIVRRMGMANVLERAGRVLLWKHADELAHLEPPARVRRALEELGPTFVKLGQVFATRVDLFEPEWIAEFGKLQDSAPPVPYADIQQQLAEDLGAPPEEIFAAFDPEPLAAASIAQVHHARLADGSEVVVKVRRPGIRPVIEADLRWLMRLAELVEAEYPELRNFHPLEIVRQFEQSLRRELDFATECRNAERIANNFAGYKDQDAASPPATDKTPVIVIPRVYWQWTGERVCVQEFIDGIPGRDLAAADRAGLDRKILARRGARAVLKMIVEDGFFH